MFDVIVLIKPISTLHDKLNSEWRTRGSFVFHLYLFRNAISLRKKSNFNLKFYTPQNSRLTVKLKSIILLIRVILNYKRCE